MRYPIRVDRPVILPDGRILRPRGRDALAMVLTPRANQTGGRMATPRNDPFAEHKVNDPSFLQWEDEGTEVVGIIRNIRSGPGRNNQVVHFLDLAIGRDDQGQPLMVACSAPTTLWSKLESSNAARKGAAVKIVYTGSRKTGSGNNVKDFDLFVLPPNMDLKSLPPDTWGIKKGQTSDGALPIEDTDGEELPF